MTLVNSHGQSYPHLTDPNLATQLSYNSHTHLTLAKQTPCFQSNDNACLMAPNYYLTKAWFTLATVTEAEMEA